MSLGPALLYYVLTMDDSINVFIQYAMNSKELFQETRKQPYAAPEVTQVEFRMERGFFGSNANADTHQMNIAAWQFYTNNNDGSVGEGRTFGENAW